MEQLKKIWLFGLLVLVGCWLITQTEQSVPNRRPGGKPAMTYEAMFREIAREYGLDWRLLARQAYRESSLDPLALGEDDDMGLMQILPSTWDEWAPKVGVSDPFDPYSNVLVGAAYLAYLREYFHAQGYPEPHWMLIAYNWGPYNVDQLLRNGGDWNQVPPLQRQYALDILRTSANTTFTWETIQAELAVKTSEPR